MESRLLTCTREFETAVEATKNHCSVGDNVIMKAVRIKQFGGSEALEIDEIPAPTPKNDEILIQVKAAGLNPVDAMFVKGIQIGEPTVLPMIPGCDISGVVSAVGSEVTQFKIGDEVYVCLGIKRNGGYAEYATAPAKDVSIKPVSISFAEAASLPAVALTSWQALFEVAHLSAGQKVLIHGASGGVGTAAIQLAKAKGAYVIATASEKNLPLLRQLGADEALDYNAAPFETVVQGADVVFDLVGGDTTDRSFQVLKPGGFLVSVAANPSAEKAAQANVKIAQVFVYNSGVQLQEIATLIDQGSVKPVIERIYPLSEVKIAFDAVASRRTRGKIVLEI